MRHTYSLTDETRKVISGKVQAVADEWDVSDKAVYAILTEAQTDPYSKFRAMFKAALRAGCDVQLYVDDLRGIVERTGTRRDVHASLQRKVQYGAELVAETVESLRDGTIDAREAARILAAARRARKAVKELEAHAQEVMNGFHK